MRENGSSTWRFHVRASIRLKEEEFYPGIVLKAHLPIPAKRYQVQEVKILSYDDGMKAVDPEDALFRTIYFEDTLQENREFYVEYDYIVKAEYHDISMAGVENAHRLADPQNQEYPEKMAEYLKEQYPHIRFSPYLRALAGQIVGNETDPLEKARKIYDYVTTKVHYSYMREYFLIEDIPQYCARNLRGDCGVQALLSMCSPTDGSTRTRPLAVPLSRIRMRRAGNFISAIWIRSVCRPTMHSNRPS